jgi:hypothetical protein
MKTALIPAGTAPSINERQVEEWLQPRLDGLTNPEIKAIVYFLFLWTCFEARSLKCSGSAHSIQRLVKRWEREGRLNVADFADKVTYFAARYVSNGTFAPEFKELHLRNNDKPALVKAVLKGENTNASDIVTAVFILVYRLRNNLFHGLKWAYQMRGELDNFTHANAVLMRALEMDLPGVRERRAVVVSEVSVAPALSDLFAKAGDAGDSMKK